jgi:hypothetical protein
METTKFNDEVSACIFRIDTKNQIKEMIQSIEDRSKKLEVLIEYNFGLMEDLFEQYEEKLKATDIDEEEVKKQIKIAKLKVDLDKLTIKPDVKRQLEVMLITLF